MEAAPVPNILVKPADDKFRPVPFGPPDHHVHGFRGQRIVRVHKADIFPGTVFQPGIPCAGNAAVFLWDDNQPRILLRCLPGNIPRAVCTAVVHEDHLQIPPRLAEYAVQRLANRGFRIMRGNHHADRRLSLSVTHVRILPFSQALPACPSVSCLSAFEKRFAASDMTGQNPKKTVR